MSTKKRSKTLYLPDDVIDKLEEEEENQSKKVAELIREEYGMGEP